ncbi:hypothetical protein ACFSL4_17220 [Streptomyces caeni]|uniref:Uncharacterized protein n=1 Tax=Streptomyces caeni TaxID=2307231 RepID=A0ABW4ITK5_9ACTN
MYRRSTMPMSLHIANGMYGAVVIDPPNLPRADREHPLVQSDLCPGPKGGTADPAGPAARRPDAVVFNGYAGQYTYAPLKARTVIGCHDGGRDRAARTRGVPGTTAPADTRLPRDAGESAAFGLALGSMWGGFEEM